MFSIEKQQNFTIRYKQQKNSLSQQRGWLIILLIFHFFHIGIEEKFQFSPRNHTFYQGLRFIRISCRPPKSSPEADVDWLWNDRKINPFTVSNFAKVVYNDPLGVLYHALEIRKPTGALAGNYTCVAKNVGGTRFANFTVTEIRKYLSVWLLLLRGS